MDVAYSSNIWRTIVVQYKQKRRWAWGVENFPFVVNGFIKNKNISSQYAFTKAGFQMTNPDRHHEKTAIVMKYAMGDHDHAEHQDQ